MKKIIFIEINHYLSQSFYIKRSFLTSSMITLKKLNIPNIKSVKTFNIMSKLNLG